MTQTPSAPVRLELYARNLPSADKDAPVSKASSWVNWTISPNTRPLLPSIGKLHKSTDKRADEKTIRDPAETEGCASKADPNISCSGIPETRQVFRENATRNRLELSSVSTEKNTCWPSGERVGMRLNAIGRP